MTIVPDASVAVELLLRTPLGENLAGRLKGATLVAPALIDCEVLAVLRKLVLKREVFIGPTTSNSQKSGCPRSTSAKASI